MEESQSRVVDALRGLIRELQTRFAPAVGIGPKLLEIEERIRRNDDHAAGGAIDIRVGVEKVGVEREEDRGGAMLPDFLREEGYVAHIGGNDSDVAVLLAGDGGEKIGEGQFRRLNTQIRKGGKDLARLGGAFLRKVGGSRVAAPGPGPACPCWGVALLAAARKREMCMGKGKLRISGGLCPFPQPPRFWPSATFPGALCFVKFCPYAVLPSVRIAIF